LLLALAFALATSGPVTLAYIAAPAPLTRLVVGDQYPLAANLIGLYAVAALLNALLSLWIAHFIGRGEMRFGVILAVALSAEVVAIVANPHDAATLVRIVLAVAAATQTAALATYWWERSRRGPRLATRMT
jgi:O-antigen/teichoic acid export membrane protein